MRQWYFLHHMKSRADWIGALAAGSTGPFGLLAVVNSGELFPHFPTTHNAIASPFHFSIFKVSALFLSPLHASRRAATTSRTVGTLFLSQFV
jgi:hypothetical protein